MIEGIKLAFTERLREIPWMDEETKLQALDKANAITDMIGYPDYILDDNALDEKYSRLEVHPDAYFDNSIRYHRFTQRENLEKLDKEVNRYAYVQ